MTKPEQNQGDIALQSKQPEKKGVWAGMREWLKRGREKKEEDVDVLAGEVEAGKVSLEEVKKEAGDEIVDTSRETIKEIGGMRDSLKEESIDDLAVVELGALVEEEQRAAVDAREEMKGVEVKEEVGPEAPSVAKKEKEKTLAEKIIGGAVECADLSWIKECMRHYEKDNMGDPGGEELAQRFETSLPDRAFTVLPSASGSEMTMYFKSGGKLMRYSIDMSSTKFSRMGSGDIVKSINDELLREGWTPSDSIFSIARGVSEKQKRIEKTRQQDIAREKIARGEFDPKGIGEYLSQAELLSNPEQIKSSVDRFKPEFGDPNKEELQKGIEHFQDLPVGSCVVDAIDVDSYIGKDVINIVFKDGSGGLKKATISVGELRDKKDDRELSGISHFSESLKRGGYDSNDKMMVQKVEDALRERGFNVVPSLFGELRVPLSRLLE